MAAMVPGLSPYHFGFNNPVRYNDPLGLMGQDAGIWGTGSNYASNNSQNPFDFLPKFTRTNPGSGNHWSDDNIPGNPNEQAIRDYYMLSGSAFEKKYGVHQSNTVIIAGGLYVIWNITRWKEYDGVANEKSYTYETKFIKAQQSGGNAYAEISDSFNEMKYDYMLAENVGVNAMFNMIGNYSVKEIDGKYYFFASAAGTTPAKSQGDVAFQGSALIVVNGKGVNNNPFVYQDGYNAAYPSRFQNIGAVSFELPTSGNVMINLNFSYHIIFGSQGQRHSAVMTIPVHIRKIGLPRN